LRFAWQDIPAEPGLQLKEELTGNLAGQFSIREFFSGDPAAAIAGPAIS
jgi:hypothetical protein